MKKSRVESGHAMACSLLSSSSMTVIRIVKLVDGEELISFENETVPPSAMDDPRMGALERRSSAEASARRQQPAPRERVH